jgi:hypothetical protein
MLDRLKVITLDIIAKMKSNNEPKLKTSKEILEEKLIELLIDRKDQNFGISIKGSWGIGKSRFWSDFSEKFEKEKYAYISLFGKTSIESIKQEILGKISTRNKIISWLQDKSGQSVPFGIDLSSLLSIADKSDFKNITICFDDFERISGKVELKDVMGLIAELKEQKGCNIVIINNNDQLEDSDQLNNIRIFELTEKDQTKKSQLKFNISRSNNLVIFRLYAEKIIDYEFQYSPTISENFSTQESRLKLFNKEIVLKFLETPRDSDALSKSYNIRLLKKLINTLNLFDFLHKAALSNEILNSIAGYIFEKIYETELSTVDFNLIQIQTLHNYIDETIRCSFLSDKEDFIERARSLDKQKIDREFTQNIYDLHQSYLYDLDFKDEEFGTKLFELFNEKADNLILLLGVNNFFFLHEMLKDVYASHINDINNLTDRVLKSYVDHISKKGSLKSDIFEADFKEQFKDFPTILDYIDKYKKELESHIIDDIISVTETIRDIRNGSGWSLQQVTTLGAIQVDTHIKYMQKSPEYFQEAYRFAKWTLNFQGSTPFPDVNDNIIKAVEKLSEKQEYKYKLTQLLKNLKKSVR